jgi:Putative prokaryotic signal transducing protein
VNDSQEQQRLVVVAVAGSEPEAEIIRQRLEESGIPAIAQRTIGGPEWGQSGSRYIYVRAPDEADARRILAAQDSSPDPAE